jgi:hypothetical protein
MTDIVSGVVIMPKLMLANEIVITALETIGMILAAFGLGVFAAWLTGVAGFLLVSGSGLVGAAYLAARQQARLQAELRANAPPPEPPPGLVNTTQTVRNYMAERQLASIRDGEPLSS